MVRLGRHFLTYHYTFSMGNFGWFRHVGAQMAHKKVLPFPLWQGLQVPEGEGLCLEFSLNLSECLERAFQIGDDAGSQFLGCW